MKILILLLCASVALARAIQSNTFHTNAKRSNASSPWDGYDINTNYYETIPDTGVVREYFFDIVNTTAALDGIERPVQLVNGQFPGPTIEANWGDTVRVHVTNQMQNNGTSIHWHGVRQLNTNQMDGVTALTQCPVAPGSSYTYEWRAEQYGSSWYHSHFSLQAWEGVFGGIVIHGPSTAEYDEDLGVMFLNDWGHQTVDEMYAHVLTKGGTPNFENGLINGTNTWTKEDGETVGKRFETTMTPGKKYLIRLVNAAIHTHWKFSIDNHNLTVIANDFVPIVPFTSEYVPMTMGQRYDIIVTADQPADNYWIRAIPQSFCSENNSTNNIRGILHYEDAPTAEPTSEKWDYGDDYQCMDFPPQQLVPWLALDADINGARTVGSAASAPSFGADPTILLWSLGGNVFNVSWDDPTLMQTAMIDHNDWAPGQGVIEIDEADEWTVLVIQTTLVVPHPVHLHGHDFYLLAAGLGNYTSDVALQTTNPPRRDTAVLPSQQNGGGYLVIAFPADNPGVWLLHCHIGFHATQGFAQQIVERRSEFDTFLDMDVMNQTCEAWDAYGEVDIWGVQDRVPSIPYDSGI